MGNTHANPGVPASTAAAPPRALALRDLRAGLGGERSAAFTPAARASLAASQASDDDDDDDDDDDGEDE